MPEIPFYAWLIIAILALALLVQLYYYLAVFSRLAFFKAPQKTFSSEPVSVIIAARNEAKNLMKNLESILRQEYPSYEVVVVNDGSWDSTLEVLEAYEKEYPHLKIVNYKEQEKYPKGKKFALMLGIKAAAHETLVFTDADCVPASPNWLQQMAGNYGSKKAIVLGYSPYNRYPNLLSLMISFETFTTAMLYFSWALKKKPYMGVGRNLSYQKQLFFKVKGFASHQHVLSGDDDLFVNETATADNVAVELSPESFVYTEPKKSWGEWMHQKARHMSTGKYYKMSDKVRLGLYYLSLALFYLLFITSLIVCFPFTDLLRTALIFFGLRLVVQYSISYITAKRLKETKLLLFLPLLDLIFIFYFMITASRALFVKSKIW
jgi:poly-beta-1,6-N-acetyl-D-glucosamine synthase